MAGETTEAREVARKKASDGFVCITGVLHDVKVLPEFGRVQWSVERAREGDEVELYAEVAPVQKGTEAKFEIFEVDADGTEESIATVDGKVEKGAARAKWKYVYTPDDEGPAEGQETEEEWSLPEYAFKVTVAGAEARTEKLLLYRSFIEVEVKDDQGRPVTSGDFVLVSHAWPVVVHGRVGPDGKVKAENVPPGDYDLHIHGHDVDQVQGGTP